MAQTFKTILYKVNMNHKKKLAEKCIEQLETQQEPSTSSQCLNISLYTKFHFGIYIWTLGADDGSQPTSKCLSFMHGDGSILPPPPTPGNTEHPRNLF